MAITDLTGTTWKLKDALYSYAPNVTSYRGDYNINIVIEGNASVFPMIQIGYESGGERNLVYAKTENYSNVYQLAYGHDTKTLPDQWITKADVYFTITGGTDATNSTLIAWFEANADTKAPDVVISYNNDEIASMTASGTKTMLTSGKYCEADIVVEYTKPTPILQTKNATPSTSSQTITADQSFDGLSSVTVSAMPSGTAGTPTATKGTVSNHSVSVTPSVTNTTGYITGGTKTGTAVSVSASELVSGTLTISSGGTKDVTNYASASVATGSALTPATSITANPSISVSSGGLITATVSALESVTPIVSAGYVTEGMAGTVTVSGSNTSQLTTQAAQTITPTTTNQTIASGKYLTGTQTILGDANLLPENIKKDVSIFNVVGTLGSGGGGTVISTNNYSGHHIMQLYDSNYNYPDVHWQVEPNAVYYIVTDSKYWVVVSITRDDTGDAVQFTKDNNTTWHFTMPNASVTFVLDYID